jgi:hypothetical protein
VLTLIIFGPVGSGKKIRAHQMGEDDSQLKDNRIRRAVPKYVVGAEKGLTLVFFEGFRD